MLYMAFTFILIEMLSSRWINLLHGARRRLHIRRLRKLYFCHCLSPIPSPLRLFPLEINKKNYPQFFSISEYADNKDVA